MKRIKTKILIWMLLSLSISACGPERSEVANETPSVRGCAADSPQIGKSAFFSSLQHGVSGRATIVSNCEIEVDQFNYDGGGIDVRVYGAIDGNFIDGISLSNDLTGPSHNNETFNIFLPADTDFDTINSLSIWCVDFRVNFGSLQFE